MSKHALLIAEKPSLMRAIRDAVNQHGFPDNITYKTFAGHTMTLKMPGEYKSEWEQGTTKIADLPMVPSPFEYKVSPDKKDMYTDLKKEALSGKYDYVINACDAGREGQHIFWSFYEEIGSPLPVKRLWSGDTTIDSLGKAINNLRDESEPRLANMKEASKLRAQFDWLIGMNGSRAFSEKTRSGLPVGRVMTPALNLVIDRELEIRNFKPQDFYEVEAEFDNYTGRYHNPKTKGRFDTKKEADDFIKSLAPQGTVESVINRKQTTKAPELFSLQTLQSEAGKKFGYTMTETLKIAQGLYDDGFLSYPRTDSSYVTKNTASTFPDLLQTVVKYGVLKDKAEDIIKDTARISEVQADKKYVDDRKVEDHDALLPTKQVPTRTLTKQEENIYDLVSRRFVAIFLPPLIVEKSRIVTDISGHPFNTNGSVLIQRGFTELYGYNPSDQTLPKVNKGDVQNVKKFELKTGKTTPPKRYTSSTLGDAMAAAGRFTDDKDIKEILKESSGIGTVATRGNIVDKLISRGWMEYKGKAKTIHGTDAGISVIQALDKHDVTSVELTAEWEDKLRDIEKGNLAPTEFSRQMDDYINKMIRDIEKKKFSSVVSGKKKGSVGSSVGACPVCGSNVITGKSVYFCESYDPNNKQNSCKFIVGRKVAGANVPATEIKKIIEGKQTKALNMKSKKGNKFKAKLFWDKTSNELKFAFEGNSGGSKGSGSKTKSKTSNGKDIAQDRFNWLVGTHKIGKEIWGVKITEKQAKEMFDGQKLGPFTFTWKSGKSSDAKVFYDKKEKRVKYDFS